MGKVPSTLRMGAILSGAVVAYSTAAFAEPVTKADLAGKKICWGDETATYGKNGSLDSNVIGHGTWSLAGDRLVGKGDHGSYTSTITKENGSFHASMYGGANGTYDAWGKYCK
jgi:hypothetical protein